MQSFYSGEKKRVKKILNGLRRKLFEILQMLDANETSFVAQCIETAAFLVAIEAHLVYLQYICILGGCNAKIVLSL
jgi:hypothetical protein